MTPDELRDLDNTVQAFMRSWITYGEALRRLGFTADEVRRLTRTRGTP